MDGRVAFFHAVGLRVMRGDNARNDQLGGKQRVRDGERIVRFAGGVGVNEYADLLCIGNFKTVHGAHSLSNPGMRGILLYYNTAIAGMRMRREEKTARGDKPRAVER